MSAHADRLTRVVGSRSWGHARTDVPTTDRIAADPAADRSSATVLTRPGSAARHHGPLPSPSIMLGFATLAAYLLVSELSGSDHARFDLVSIPLFVATALLQKRTALLVGVAAVGFAFAPVVADRPGAVLESARVIEVAVVAVVAVLLRRALARRATAEADQADRDALSAERTRTVLEIAERMSRTFDRNEIFRTIVAELPNTMRADVATIRIVRGDHLVLTAWAGIPDEIAARVPVIGRDEPWFVDMVRTGRAILGGTAGGRPRAAAGSAPHVGVSEYATDVAVPLVHRDVVIGTLAAASLEPHDWSSEDVDFMAAVATHASIAIHNAELFEQTEARAAQLAVLQAASARMNRQSSVESVGRAIVEETRRFLDYHNARVYLLDGDALVPIAFEGAVGEYEKVDLDLLRTSVGRGFTGWAAQHDEALLVDDANADPRGLTIPGTDDVDESMLVVPIRYDERVIGVVTLSKLGLGGFGQEDLRLLSILADQAATALESARLLGRSQQLAGELRRLVDMGGELAHSLDPNQVAAIIARHLAQAMGVTRCTVSHWLAAEGRIETLGAYPSTVAGGVEPSYDLAGFPETLRVLVGQATTVVDADDPRADRAEVELMRAEGFATLVMMPLVANGETIGLVELLAERHVAYDVAHLELARTMANEAAMALENARLYAVARALADRDQLTGFFNHRYLHERLGEEIIRARRSRRPVSVLMIDVDDFKLVNDTFGHLFGDRVLAWVAELIRSTLRGSDVAARYGGDEFAVILPETDAAAARRAADRILDACRMNAFQAESRGPLPIGLSIGVGTFPAAGRAGQDVIAAADRALYRAKSAGGRAAADVDDVVDVDARVGPDDRFEGGSGRARAG